MNSGPIIFVGLFATIACTWTGFVLGPQMQLGDLTSTNTVVVGKELSQSYPIAQAGIAHQGAEVYRANGCAACHTQVVRPVQQSSDISRFWGLRRSVAEDYVFETPVMIGSTQVGPDLANVGRRLVFDTNDMNLDGVYLRLYDPELVAGKSGGKSTGHSTVMPSYRFLFKKQKIGFHPSRETLHLPDQDAPPSGYEIVPTDEAKALVYYLINLKQDGYLFDAPPKLPPTNAVPTNAVAPAMPSKK